MFLKSLLKGPSTGPGSCLGVFTDTVTAPLKQVQSAVKNYVPLIVGAMQAGPSGAAMYMQQLNNMVASGAAEADPQVGGWPILCAANNGAEFNKLTPPTIPRHSDAPGPVNRQAPSIGLKLVC